MADTDDTVEESKAKGRARLKKKTEDNVKRGEQETSIEDMYAAHLLADHGSVAMGDTPSKFHTRYYRSCPFVPAPLP